MNKNHVRNVAGISVTKVSKAVYQQSLGDGKQRWFVRFSIRGQKGYHWRYTRPFKLGEKIKTSLQFYGDLTACVMAANGIAHDR